VTKTYASVCKRLVPTAGLLKLLVIESQLFVRSREWRQECLIWHHLARLRRIPLVKRVFPNGASFMRVRISMFLARFLPRSFSPSRRFRAGRDGGALRHFDGRYSPDHRPAGPRRRRLSFSGYTILRSLVSWEMNVSERPGKLVPGLATEWKVDDKDKTSGASPCARREIPRRQRFQRDGGDLESRQVLNDQGAAIRQAPERAGETRLPRSRATPRSTTPASRSRPRRSIRSSPIRCSGSDFEPGAI